MNNKESKHFQTISRACCSPDFKKKFENKQPIKSKYLSIWLCDEHHSKYTNLNGYLKLFKYVLESSSCFIYGVSRVRDSFSAVQRHLLSESECAFSQLVSQEFPHVLLMCACLHQSAHASFKQHTAVLLILTS